MLTRVEKKDIPGSKTYSPIRYEIERFWLSDWDAAEIDSSWYKSPESCRNAWNLAISRARLNIRVLVRNGRVFLTKPFKGVSK